MRTQDISSTNLVSKSSIEIFMSASDLIFPCFFNTSLVRSQYTVARAFLPLLFAGMTKSTLEVTLSLFAIATTGTPALVAQVRLADPLVDL